jgi:uncharacterized protein
MVRYILIDGYNVIRADPRLSSLENVSLEHARTVLIQTVGSAPRLANDRVTVIFDGGRGERTNIHGHRVGRIEVVYSARGQTADDVIVGQAKSLGGQERVVVVSNDVDVRERCRAHGCEVSGSENLLGQMPGRAAPRRQDNPESDRALSLSTVKRGNPRRTSRRDQRKRDVRF